MRDTQTHRRPSSPRLLRFLLPVLLAHALLLAALPYWPAGRAPGRPGVDVELAAIATPAPAPGAASETQPAAAPRPPTAPPPVTPAATKPAPPTRPVRTPATVQTPPPVAAPAEIAADPGPARTAGATRHGQNRQAEVDATAPAQPGTDWRDDYRSALRDALAAQHRYPPRARRFGLSGEARVGFRIRRDGGFDDIHLVHSSDAELLDGAALATVRRLGRFRPLPRSYSEDSWAVEVPLVYRPD